MRSAGVAEPLAGTARHASAWLLIEQPGPWGKHALLDSHLPTDLGQALLTATEGTGVEPLLIRRPGRHADAHAGHHRTVLLASVHPDHRWMRRWELEGDEALSAWIATFDAEATARGIAPSDGEPWAVPTLALCTHARRDLCCALAGRGLLDELLPAGAEQPDGWLWECSHLGGHRFAPTALALPSGLVLGRTDAAACLAALNGEVPWAQARGFSWLEPAAQVADLAVRAHLGTTGSSADVRVEEVIAGPEGVRVRVSADGGRSWLVDVAVAPVPPRPASCGKDDETPQAFMARAVIPAS